MAEANEAGRAAAGLSALDRWLVEIGGGRWLADVFDVAMLVLVATLVYFVLRWVLIRAVRRFAANTSTHWDDELVAGGLFTRIAHIAPAYVVYYGTQFLTNLPEAVADGLRRIAVAIMVLVGALAISSFLRAAEAIYNSHPEYRERPIKGYLQVVSIIVYLVAALLILAALMNRSPWIFVSGIGAMTAVLLLIFRDTILSLVASVQIAGNDMIRVGDWIEMPDLGADGDVIEIALHTVKVQNWDKTITTIPTHRLISESFKNWRGMSLSGGRRIKRSVSIDLQTVRFLTPEEIEDFGHWALLRDYIRNKRAELEEANGLASGTPLALVDQRRLTNLGTLRAWIRETLRSHPDLHREGYTLMVRQLPAGPEGIPIEVYCFSNDTDWVRYENIQADLFDRILAMVPEFGLRVFQQPSGADFGALIGEGDARARGHSRASGAKTSRTSDDAGGSRGEQDA